MIIPNIWDFCFKIFHFTIMFINQLYNFLFYEFEIFLPVFNERITTNILSLFAVYLPFVLIARLLDKLPIF